MNRADRRKSEVLGMACTTAHHRLVRKTLYWLANRCGLAICFRCSKHIDEESFTIEHKAPWLDDVAAYWDMENIAFSHLSCNSSAARRRTPRCETQADLARGHPERYRSRISVDTSRFKEAKERLARGDSERSVAKALGLHHSTFQAIVNGRTWKREWAAAPPPSATAQP